MSGMSAFTVSTAEAMGCQIIYNGSTIGNFCKCLGIIWATRVEEPAADAKKAKGASWAALLIPSLPFLTRREAWGHAETEPWRELLVMLLRVNFSRLSYTWSSVERKQGEVQRMYDSLGITREWRRRRRES